MAAVAACHSNPVPRVGAQAGQGNAGSSAAPGRTAQPTGGPSADNAARAGGTTAAGPASTPAASGADGTAATNVAAKSPRAVRDTSPVPRTDDVARTASNVFGEIDVPVPMVDVSIGPVWDMDVKSYENQERVAYYVNLFTQTARDHFQERLHLGTRYEPMIRAKLKAGGIPEDMSYLALVESGFDPNAYSSAAAVGMWQFMSSTARDVGLRVDWWVDERRDPARSTDAAIRFIRDLQNQFGSLYLAAAAYNGGPGRVSRSLTRFAEEMVGSEGEDRFFALADHDAFRSETKNYVPQIIAAALVGKEPLRYGLAYDTLAQYAYDSIEVAAGTTLSAVAKSSATDLTTIKELNPAVLRGIVPPNSSMWVRLPHNGLVPAEDVAHALVAMAPDERLGFRSVHASGSETPSSLAEKAGVSSRALAMYNPNLQTTRKGKLVAGQTVLVPTPDAVAAANNVPDPSIERYGSSTVAATRNGSVHIVKRGETLARIAANNGMSVARLKALNGIKGNKAVAGQALRLKPAPTALRSASSKSKASAKSSAKSATAKRPVAKAAVKKATTSKSPPKSPPKSSTKKTAARPESSKRAASTKIASGRK